MEIPCAIGVTVIGYSEENMGGLRIRDALQCDDDETTRMLIIDYFGIESEGLR